MYFPFRTLQSHDFSHSKRQKAAADEKKRLPLLYYC
jgi:hypothetical protein